MYGGIHVSHKNDHNPNTISLVWVCILYIHLRKFSCAFCQKHRALVSNFEWSLSLVVYLTVRMLAAALSIADSWGRREGEREGGIECKKNICGQISKAMGGENVFVSHCLLNISVS